MIVKTIPSTWLIEEEHRLDCGPFVKGGVEARKTIEGLRYPKDHLVDLTKDGINGMYHVGQDKIVWAEDEIHGMPFLRSADILKADFSNQPLISKKQVANNYLFQCPLGTTLITRSGSIGRMAYMRSDMIDTAISQDVLKVVPDAEKVRPGYLYAFLSSKYGIPIITGGTFGSIIVHIEAENIADLPVPRLGLIEDNVHQLIQRAADLRSSATTMIQNATSELIRALDLPPLPTKTVSNLGWSVVTSSNLRNRLDATFHCPSAMMAEDAVKNGRFSAELLSSVTSNLFKPPIFKRIWVDSEEHGRQFISGTDAYLYEANELRYVSYRTPNFDDFIVKEGWVIFQAAGQIYGLFGQPIFVSGWQNNLFCADDLYRIVPNDKVDGAYIYLFLRTPHGEVLVKRQASGNSIPRVWDPHMANFEIPWPSRDIREQFAAPVIDAHNQIKEALVTQRQAIALVERAIEEGGR